MTNVLDRRDVERTFRAAISTIELAKSQVTKLVDSDWSGPAAFEGLNDTINMLEADREAFKDWLRE